jgi:uncharacterized membrane protein YvbJ
MIAKYCYKCGTRYGDRQCPECGSTIHTTSPNSQTKKLEAKNNDRNGNKEGITNTKIAQAN